MNWLLLAAAALIIFHVYDGAHRGFIRKAVSMASFVITLVLVTWLTPQITDFLSENTAVYSKVQEHCMKIFADKTYDEDEKSEQVLAIEDMQLPKSIKERLLENNNHEVYDLLEVTGFYEYVGAYLARMMIHTFSYLLAFAIVWALLKAAMAALDVITKLPLLHGINQIAGAVLGGVQGIAIVWIVFLVVTVFCSGEIGKYFFELISESEFLTFLYENNMIMQRVYDLVI